MNYGTVVTKDKWTAGTLWVGVEDEVEKAEDVVD